MTKLIVTPFLIIIGILEILLFFLFIYHTFIDNNGGKALGGTIAFFGFIIFFFVLLVEQFILKSIKIKKESIWVLESIILIIAIIYIYFNGISIG